MPVSEYIFKEKKNKQEDLLGGLNMGYERKEMMTPKSGMYLSFNTFFTYSEIESRLSFLLLLPIIIHRCSES
jgi:hypothetical protein